MKFFNHSTRAVWLGIYDSGDTLYTLTALPLGARVLVKAETNMTRDEPFAMRMQVAVWESGALGSVIAQPRTVYANRDVSFAEDSDGAHIYNGSELPTVIDKIQHVFVLAMENRSFDHLLGWLYAKENNRPPVNVPPQYEPTYEGLSDLTYWNTPVASDHDGLIGRVYASRAGPSVFTKPDPNPPEICPRFIEGMFGSESPAASALPQMTGFIQAYAKRSGGNPDPNGIMECYTSDHVPRLSSIARAFAVCDGWFASLPCMTYPNRSFLHAGTSFGRLNNNNDKYSEGDWPDVVPNVFAFAGKETVFDEFDKLEIPFALYTDSQAKVTLLGAQFFTAPQKVARPFRRVSDLKDDLSRTDVHQRPWYTFIEPEYLVGANDQHPPLDVRIGDAFIGRVFDIISGSPIWKKSMFVLLYDEAGGCFDHVAPPGAVPPDSSPAQFQVGDIDVFNFYGPRVPAVVASPHLAPGTVFRSFGTPYDHTSVLSTLRDMLFPYDNATAFFTRNARIAIAPTLWDLFSQDASGQAVAEVAWAYLLGD